MIDLAGPIEQLSLTENDSDYLYYSVEIPSSMNSLDTLKVSALDGTIVYPRIVSSEISNSLVLLSCAMGMTNGGIKPSDGKGITEVVLQGQNLTSHEWRQDWHLSGEVKQVHSFFFYFRGFAVTFKDI